MSSVALSLDELSVQATSKSPKVRGRLAVAMCEFFETDVLTGEGARAVIGRLLSDVVATVDRDVRMRVAEKLAQIDAAPHDVIIALALDEIGVAEPVLARSSALLEEDLLRVIDDATTQHRETIAGRSDLNSLLTDALAGAREVEVLAKLLTNRSAPISKRGFAICVDESRNHTELHAPLTARDELPQEFATTLYLLVGEALKQELATRHGLETGLLQRMVGDVLVDSFEPNSGSAQEAREPGAAALVSKLKDAGRLSNGVVVRAVQEGRVEFFDHAVAALTGVPVGGVRAAMTKDAPNALALVCCAVGLDKGAFPMLRERLAQLGRGPQNLGAVQAAVAARALDENSPESAREALRVLARRA